LVPQKLDILWHAPIAEDMINEQTTLFIYTVVSVNRNIVKYNKYLLVITVVVVFVSHCYSY